MNCSIPANADSNEKVMMIKLSFFSFQLSQMLKSFPGVFTNQQIVHICDLSTLAGRKIAAKAVSHNSRL